MCIAIYKPADVALPSEDTLHECWWANPMGAGMAYWDDESQLWTIKKGYMTWDAFLTAWNDLDEAVGLLDRQTMVHFRISTSGILNSGECTHPFPITRDEEQLNALDVVTPNIVFHNGVVGAGEGDLSDTQVAIRDDIDPLYPLLMTGDSRIYNILDRVLLSTSCRWMVGLGNDIWTWGEWIIDEDIYYSNNGYLTQEMTVKKRGNGKPVPPTRSGRSKPPTTQHGTYGEAITPAPASTIITRTGDHKCEYVTIPQTDIHSMINKEGKFSWAKWKAWCLDSAGNAGADDYPDVIEVYSDDAYPSLKCLVDSTGDVIYDKEDDDDGSSVLTRVRCDKCGVSFPSQEDECPDCGTEVETDWKYECVDCGLTYHIGALLDNYKCPMCGNMTFCTRDPAEISYTSPTLTCPHCAQKNYLLDSSEPVGDTECGICGAIWDSTHAHTVPIMFNYEVHKIYNENQARRGGN